MKDFFYPQRVAIIGVTDTPTNMGRFIIKNLIEFNFKGTFYLVGRDQGALYGKHIYESVLNVPEKLDLGPALL